MPAFGTSVASDLLNAALDFHVRGPVLKQTLQDRPLLAFLQAGKKTFPGGKTYVTEPVQGDRMSSTAGFFAGYSEDDQLAFTQSQGIQRAQFAWKNVHAGLVITHDELRKDGITVSDGEVSTTDHSSVLHRLTAIFENRTSDYMDSWNFKTNEMLWRDGSQDSKQTPGVLALLLEDPTAGTVGALAQATYSWWRSRANMSLTPSANEQSISKFFRNEIIQLRRYGGRPNKLLCGSLFWDALMEEVDAKATVSKSDLTGTNDIGMTKISVQGIGTFEYDPTLDDLGMSGQCFVFDSRRITLRPMEGEENKTYSPARPHDYMIFLKSMSSTLALQVTQLNAMARYGINEGA